MGLRLIDRIRRSHAIEHGTVAVLLERGARPPLGGYGMPGGFFIYGKLSTEDVSSAAAGAMVQRHFTTLSEVDNVEIIETRRYQLAGRTLHRISTRDSSR